MPIHRGVVVREHVGTKFPCLFQILLYNGYFSVCSHTFFVSTTSLHIQLEQACTTQKARRAKLININLPRAATAWYYVVVWKKSETTIYYTKLQATKIVKVIYFTEKLVSGSALSPFCSFFFI